MSGPYHRVSWLGALIILKTLFTAVPTLVFDWVTREEKSWQEGIFRIPSTTILQNWLTTITIYFSPSCTLAVGSVRTAHLCSTWGSGSHSCICSQFVELTGMLAGPWWPHIPWASASMSGMAGPLILRGLCFSITPQALFPSKRWAGVCPKASRSKRVRVEALRSLLEIGQNHVCHFLGVKASHEASWDSGRRGDRPHCWKEGAVKPWQPCITYHSE